MTFISLCAMPAQVGFATGNYGYYGGFQPAPRNFSYKSDEGPQRRMVMRDRYYGSTPRLGTWARSMGEPSSFRPRSISIPTGGFARAKRVIIDDDPDVEMIAAPPAGTPQSNGMYRIGGRGRYQRKRMYNRRRMRRY